MFALIKLKRNKRSKRVNRHLRNGYSVALMIDQRVSEGERINFFKKPAFTTTLPAQLSKKFNIFIVPVYIERQKKGENFYIEFQKKINPHDFSGKLDLTEKLNGVLEEMVSRNPSLDLDTQ